jgi:2-dehydro-3-deoxygluconokinase
MFRRGFAGDSHSDRFVAAMAADGLGTTIVSRAPDHQMGLYLIELDGAERRFHYWRQQSTTSR